MALKDDLDKEVAAIFKAAWDKRDGTVVPADDSLRLGNDAVALDATVLYADLADSTSLVDSHIDSFAAEIYKTFLHCAAKIIRQEGGTITAYDGDRIMAVYLGNSKNTSAVRTALKINHAVTYIINPAMQVQYPGEPYRLKHVVGIDNSRLVVARTGVRGANDLVWVGRAANYAAKLATLPEAYGTYITAQVHDNMNTQVTTWTDGRAMWEAVRWANFNNSIVYRSNWWWNVDYVR
jgi:class 3 adenylate cyclase